MVAIMEPLDQTDVEKQSNEIKEEKLEENIDGGVDSLIQNKIKTEVKQEYVEPTSLSQVKIDPLEIKTEDVKEENVDGDVDYLIKNEIKTEIKEEYVEPTSLSQVKVDPLEIKTEDVEEENVDGVVGSLIHNEIKTEIKTEDLKEEHIETEVPDFQKPFRTEGEQIIPEPEEAALTTTCGHCERNFDDVSGLERHLKNNHRAKKSIECPHCDEIFSKQAGLEYHVHEIHSDEARKKQPPALAPLRQTKSPPNKKNAKEKAGKKEEAGPGPLEKAMLSLPWKCNVCDANLSTSSGLGQHKKIHKGYKTNKCDSCDYATFWAHDLKKHMKIHNGEKLTQMLAL